MYREGRKQAGLSNEEAAFRLHVSSRMLSKYEAGEVTPAPETVTLMAQEYGQPEMVSRYCRECPIGAAYGYEVLDGVNLDLASVILSLRQEAGEAVEKLVVLERLARNRNTRADFAAGEWEAFEAAIQQWLDVEHNLAAMRLALGRMCDTSELIRAHNDKCRARGYTRSQGTRKEVAA